MLITQAPSTLGLGSYPHSQVEFTVHVREGPELKQIRLTRWCVQLGFTSQVLRIAQGPTVTIAQSMVRMVCKQPEEFGWPSQARASSVTNVLQKHDTPLVAITEVQVRADISSTFWLHSHVAQKDLQISGAEGSFFKVHLDSQADFAMADHFLVWLPDHTALDDGRRGLEGLEHLGLVCKRKSAPHRFAARFATQSNAQALCAKHKLEDTSDLGRWKVYGLPIAAGIPGAMQFLVDQDWSTHVVEHFDGKVSVSWQRLVFGQILCKFRLPMVMRLRSSSKRSMQWPGNWQPRSEVQLPPRRRLMTFRFPTSVLWANRKKPFLTELPLSTSVPPRKLAPDAQRPRVENPQP